MKKKLIEVALPLDAINKESAREKSIRHGHPSTLHLWWSRKPTATARAVIWASLVDDPSSNPEEFPTEEEQNAERQRLFKILEELVVWENSNNEDVLNRAKAEIWRSTNGNPPALLDPFAGGGSIPLEAQRLGLEAHAHDLNPVAVMINKAMIEIPPKFAGMPPVNPEARKRMDTGWKGAAGLAEDVCYYGEWMKQEAFKRIGHLYPKVKDEYGHEYTVIAWMWTRTMKCPNPMCGCKMPLSSSFVLSKASRKEAWVEPIVEDKDIRFIVHDGKCPKENESNKVSRSAIFKCLSCGETTLDADVRQAGKKREIGAQLMAIIAEGNRGRLYFAPTKQHEEIAQIGRPDIFPSGTMPDNPRWFSPPAFGMTNYSDLFTNRQLTALTTFTDLITDVQERVEGDAIYCGVLNARDYGQAIATYLTLVLDREVDFCSSISGWNMSTASMQHMFVRQAIPMVWNYAEANLFSSSSGSFSNMLSGVAKSIRKLPTNREGFANQFDAQKESDLKNVMVSTDPPYYDNIGYADLSDYFYVWMRQSLKKNYSNLFETMLVPKTEELVATPYRFGGSAEKARVFFEKGMLKTCQQLYKCTTKDVPVTIYYAYKQKEVLEAQLSSSGWETMLSAIIESGFVITGTWPMRTEKVGRTNSIDTNALASSIVLVCRKRAKDAPMSTRRDFVSTLKRELKSALKKLQTSNIAPVDLAQSAIGPGMGVYSRFSSVLEADGTPMSVRSALQIINQELDLYFNEQDSELDKESRFCVELYTQSAFNTLKFGDADTLARAKNTSVDKLRAMNIVYAEKSVVRLLTREELPEKINSNVIWLLTQQLTRAMEKDGVTGAAKIVSEFFTAEPEHAKALAYRLFTIADSKGWAGEAFAYNSLIVAWPEVQSRAADIAAGKSTGTQITLGEE